MGKGNVCRALGSVVLLGAVVLAGCGGGGKSGTPTASSSSSTQTLKRVDVHVTKGGTAEGPRSHMLAMIGAVLGWPREAEAASGIPGCQVSGGGATPVQTDANG